MALRLIEIFLPGAQEEEARSLLDEAQECCLDLRLQPLSDDQIMIRVLVFADRAEAILDQFDQRFSDTDDFRIVLLPVEACLPRPDEEEKASTSQKGGSKDEDRERISREELYSDVTDTATGSWSFLVLVALSSVVAAVGLMRDDVAVIVGAMVIAPLLGPNMALALAATLGDFKLALMALRVNAYGIGVALVISMILGYLLRVDPTSPALAARTTADISDIVLALAAGGAGALSFTVGVPAALVGVMVAVALLPPLVVLGLLLGSAQWTGAAGAFLLTATNVICINLSGITAFMIQGIRPSTWWEADQAKKAARRAMIGWISLLLALAAVIYLWEK